jgi:hypothetical protein
MMNWKGFATKHSVTILKSLPEDLHEMIEDDYKKQAG